jgi:hypothetical protein
MTSLGCFQAIWKWITEPRRRDRKFDPVVYWWGSGYALVEGGNKIYRWSPRRRPPMAMGSGKAILASCLLPADWHGQGVLWWLHRRQGRAYLICL